MQNLVGRPVVNISWGWDGVVQRYGDSQRVKSSPSEDIWVEGFLSVDNLSRITAVNRLPLKREKDSKRKPFAQTHIAVGLCWMSTSEFLKSSCCQNGIWSDHRTVVHPMNVSLILCFICLYTFSEKFKQLSIKITWITICQDSLKIMIFNYCKSL